MLEGFGIGKCPPEANLKKKESSIGGDNRQVEGT
jgi:hypothetical protein